MPKRARRLLDQIPDPERLPQQAKERVPLASAILAATLALLSKALLVVLRLGLIRRHPKRPQKPRHDHQHLHARHPIRQPINQIIATRRARRRERARGLADGHDHDLHDGEFEQDLEDDDLGHAAARLEHGVHAVRELDDGDDDEGGGHGEGDADDDADEPTGLR